MGGGHWMGTYDGWVVRGVCCWFVELYCVNKVTAFRAA